MIDPVLAVDNADAAEPAEPIPRTEPTDPIEPIDARLPIEAMLSVEPRLAMDRNESCEAMDHLLGMVQEWQQPTGWRRDRPRLFRIWSRPLWACPRIRPGPSATRAGEGG